MGQFLTLKNMVTEFIRNSNFSDFLGIKSEISQYVDRFWRVLRICANYCIMEQSVKWIVISDNHIQIFYTSADFSFLENIFKNQNRPESNNALE